VLVESNLFSNESMLYFKRLATSIIDIPAGSSIRDPSVVRGYIPVGLFRNRFLASSVEFSGSSFSTAHATTVAID
jgi:hypothetical protein